MSEANRQNSSASVDALKALAEQPIREVLRLLHDSPLAKAMHVGGYELAITAERDDTVQPTLFRTNCIMVPTRERADDKAEILRLQNELRKANEYNAELSARGLSDAQIERFADVFAQRWEQKNHKAPTITNIKFSVNGEELIEAIEKQHTHQQNPSEISEAEKALDSFPEPPISADWAGRTQVVREPPPGSEKDPSGGPVRFVEITSIDGPSASGTWKHGDKHVFCRYTGRCLESSNGAMAGWMIAPHEMHRHCTKPDAAGEGVSP